MAGGVGFEEKWSVILLIKYPAVIIRGDFPVIGKFKAYFGVNKGSFSPYTKK
jgi:hypothetical protein